MNDWLALLDFVRVLVPPDARAPANALVDALRQRPDEDLAQGCYVELEGEVEKNAINGALAVRQLRRTLRRKFPEVFVETRWSMLLGEPRMLSLLLGEVCEGVARILGPTLFADVQRWLGSAQYAPPFPLGIDTAAPKNDEAKNELLGELALRMQAKLTDKLGAKKTEAIVAAAIAACRARHGERATAAVRIYL